MNAAFCSKLFMKSCKCKEKERREDVQPGLGGNLNLGPPEWQPSVLTTTPCHIYIFVKVLSYNVATRLN